MLHTVFHADSQLTCRDVVLALATVALASCGSDEKREDVWIDLAHGFTPAANDRRAPSAGSLTIESAGDGALVSTAIASEDWHYRRRSGVWHAQHAIRAYPEDAAATFELRSAFDAFRSVDPPLVSGDSTPEPNTFTAVSGSINLCLSDDSEAPNDARLTHRVNRGSTRAGAWHVAGRRFSGRGLSVWPGETARLPVEIERPSVLRFAIVAERALSDASPGGTRVVFRVHHAQTVIFERAVDVPEEGSFAWQAIELGRNPDGLVKEGTGGITFSVDGDFAYTSFLAPTLGPFPDRTPEQSAPDVIVFLADTFRADNLVALGSDLPIAPYLDLLATESLFFEQAYSTSTWTLPAHASLFTGLYPMQAGVANHDEKRSSEIPMLAASLSASGYRTGAITDRGFVSRAYGLERGFDWFDERRAGMASTAERANAFLAADDGRPVFLFIQTYSLHTPYKFGDATRSAWETRLDLSGEFDDLHARSRSSGNEDDVAAAVAKLRDHYRAGVVEFDQSFGELHREWTSSGVLDNAYLFFLSDHGEAFLEHSDSLFHGTSVWNAEARIPLMIHGPYVEPRTVSTPVSLVDVPVTIFSLASLDPSPDAAGQSLLAPAHDRPLFTFQCAGTPESQWAIIEGNRKSIGFENTTDVELGRIVGSFDLTLDPGEIRDTSNSDASWAESARQHMREAWPILSTPRGTSTENPLSGDRAEELRALGYLGD